MDELEKTKEKRIKNETTRLKKIFKEIEPNLAVLAKRLIENAAFMAVTLQDLALEINEVGSVITSTNGNGFEVRSESPEQKAYNAMMQRYIQCTKQLSDMLPDAKSAAANKAGGKLIAFIQEGKPGGVKK